MSVSHRYRNFGGSNKPPAEPSKESPTSEALEEQKLQAFEAGYQAGWDDAAKARQEEKDKLSAELAQNLLDMSFTYHEALSKLTLSLEPAIQTMIERLLPEIQRNALGAHIIEQISALVDEQLAGPVEIVVHPKNIETVRTILEVKLSKPFEIVGEDTLGEGQAFVRIGDGERQIDLDTVVAEIAKAMTAFFHESAQETANG